MMTSANIAAIVNNDTSSPETATHLRQSDEIADELAAADRVVIATPMYNLFIPAGLKAYIDLLIRRGKNFEDSPTGPAGLLADRPLLVIVTAGGPCQAIDQDFLHSYFTRVFGFIGIHQVQLITADKLNMSESLINHSLEVARQHIGTTVAKL
jgi:FMN-dependent NADH-azoreductase